MPFSSLIPSSSSCLSRRRLLLLIDLTGPLFIQFVSLGCLLGLAVFTILFQLLPLLLRLAPLLLSAFLLFFLK